MKLFKQTNKQTMLTANVPKARMWLIVFLPLSHLPPLPHPHPGCSKILNSTDSASKITYSKYPQMWPYNETSIGLKNTAGPHICIIDLS